MTLGNAVSPEIKVRWRLPHDVDRLSKRISGHFGQRWFRIPLLSFLNSISALPTVRGVAFAYIGEGNRQRLSMYILLDFEDIAQDNLPTEVLREEFRQLLHKAHGKLDLDVSFANTKGETIEEGVLRLARRCSANQVEVAVTQINAGPEGELNWSSNGSAEA